jgi:hypothetical protein
MVSISKYFGSSAANEKVDLEVKKEKFILYLEKIEQVSLH